MISLPACRDGARARRAWWKAIQLGMLAFIATGAVRAWAQPANDNFVNAVVISGNVGQITGDNTNATMEAGEPTIVTTSVGLSPVGASVWYQWTAPSSGNVSFDTVGSSFDTVVVVYTGTSVNSLTEIGADDDSGGNLTSSLTISAVQGTTYYISVNGFNYPPVSQGAIVLNWNGQGAITSGQFRFTQASYAFSQNESLPPRDQRGLMTYVPARVTVTRVKGFTGLVDVGYTVTNSFYTNIYTTNFFGTNILSSLTDSNGIALGFTNTFSTNATVTLTYENYQNGYFYSTIFLPGYTSGFTNSNGVIIGSTTNQVLTNLVFCGGFNQAVTNVTVDTSGNTNVLVTTLFCTNAFATNIVPSASGFPVGGVLGFKDYQMSSNIFVPMFPSFTFADVNPLMLVILNSVQLDALEDQTLPAPTIDTNRSLAYVTFLNTDIVPGATGLQPTTNSIFNFERATIRCTESVNGSHIARVAVVRTGTNLVQAASISYRADFGPGSGDLNIFPLQAGSDYATPDDHAAYSANVDFTNVSGTLNFPANFVPGYNVQYINIPIVDDEIVEFNEDIYLQLDPQSAPTGTTVGNIGTCNLTILFDSQLSPQPTNAAGDWFTGEQPAGSVDRSYNPDNWPTTTPAYNLHPGANGTVYAVAEQPDGMAVIAGDFTGYNTTARNRIARVKFNGLLDTTFDPGSGANNFVTSLQLDGAGNILLGGGFTSINGTLRNRIARLTSSGALDSTFDTGFGADGTVWSIALQTDGRILIAGEFTSINGTNRAYVARLNSSGSLDTTFDPGAGPDGIVNSVAVQLDGRIIIGGAFSSVDGASRKYIARLNSDGTLDTTFDPGFGADDVVYAVASQPDGRVLLGGAFNQVGQLGGKGLARLNGDGSVDTSFDVGIGADDIVYSLALQSDGKILAGGIFKSINQTRRISFARLSSSGAVDTDFMDTAYNQFAGLINPYFDPNINPPNPVYAMAVQADGDIIIGGSFSQVGGGFTRDDIRQRGNVARLIGGATPGPGTIELVNSSYSADSASPQFFITLSRTNGTLGPASATVEAVPLPPGPGSATYGTDYTFSASAPIWGVSWPRPTWMLSDGLSGPNNDEIAIDGTFYRGFNNVFINIISNSNPNTSLNLGLTKPKGTDIFFLGGTSLSSANYLTFNVATAQGENIPLGVALGRSLAPLTIVHNNTHPGVLNFSSPTFTVNENGVNAVISVARVNGSDGTVTVKYTTTTNGTARAGIDYTVKSGTLTFGPGQTNQTFSVPITDNSIAQPDRTVGLSISTATGGATLGLTTAQLVIVDNDFAPGHVSYSSGTYGINENATPAVITVSRLGGSLGTLSVSVGTSNGSAVNGVNYVGSTNILTWNNGDSTTRTVSIPIFDDGIVTSNLTVNLRFLNPTVNGTNQPLVLGGIFTNATLFITNVDSVGTVEFTASSYTVNENGGQAIIPVARTGGSAQSISVNFSTGGGTAFPGADYVPTNGVLVFNPGEVGKLIRVSMIDNGVQDPPRFLGLVLSNAIPTNALGSPSTALLNITDDESFNQPPGQPDTAYSPLAGFNDSVYSLALQGDGSLLAGGDFTLANGVPRNRIARLKPDGTLDTKFLSYFPTFGANATIRSIVVQTDKRILIGGFFTSFNSVVMNRVGRLNQDGSLDSSFNPGAGANNPVYSLAETFVGGQRRILVGGAFTLINSASRNFIARLLNNGAVDLDFNPGSGANGTVYAIAMQSDGKAVIGGDFNSVNGTPLNHVARLNVDGSVDTTFNPGAGASDSVRAIAIQFDGRILIGGLFTNVNGVARSHIARLNSNGSVDALFTPGVGGNDNVETIALQADTRIIVGGDFTRFSGVTRNYITRLNPDGTVDPTINFGTGADSFVAQALVQADGNILLGGGFSNYNDQPHAHVVRIYGGSVAGSGSFEFSSANYQVQELGSNAVVTVRRTGGTSGPNSDGTGIISVHFATSPGTAVVGVNYGTIVTNLAFPAGEVIKTVTIPILDDGVITPDLTVNLALSNPSPPAGIGNQPFATLTIINNDSAIVFSSGNYIVGKNDPSGVANIGILRQGSTNGTVNVTYMTTTNGTAVIGTDYASVSNLIVFGPGVVSNNVAIPIVNNGLPEGNRTVTMTLTNAVNADTNLANVVLLPPSSATLTIIDTVLAPGQLMFSATNYLVTEGNSNAIVTVIRTNGSSGTVSVGYRTIPGTAAPGVNYTSVSSTLTFGNGETVKTFVVPLLENSLVQGPVTLSLVLSNAVGGATLVAPTNVPMTILDNDVGIAFSSAAYVVNETNGSVTLNVLRFNVTNSTVQVNYSTTNGTALAGTNYLATTGTLTFNPGEANKSLIIPILHDPRATSNVTFTVNLSNPTAGAQLTFPSSASVIVLDAEAGLGFTNSTFGVLKNGTNVVLTVFCSNPNVEPVSVNFASADGTAVAGIDYTAVNGILTFTNGMVTNYIVVPIIANSLIEGDRTFTVSLSSPTPPGQLVAPSTASVTITDINAGFSFSSPAYTVLKNGVSATIGVVRTGYTNSTASVNYATQNGTGTNGVDYVGVSGTLVFTNGQTGLSFTVPVIDSTTVKPDKTVLLQLSSPVGTNAVLVSPSAAILTIHDNSGSLVVPAGTALLTESGPVNGIIDPGETVSLLFALRNAGGTNTANLVATLLTTNGVTLPSAAQNYGALLVNGPSVSRQFSFTASGTNGQAVAATFQLQDGAANVGTATFTFILGNSSAQFTNNAQIVINDATASSPSAATPYPSTINVSGVGGSLTKATVTFNKLSHAFAADVDALLVSPAGQKTLLMANAGGSFTLNNVTLTFDDAAASFLPQGSQITTGTNKPTTYYPVAVFPSAPAAPYTTNLAAFNGSNPNGVWSLYVIDDSQGQSGIISNGWSMNLTTANLVGSTADLVASMTGSPNPVIVSNPITYTMTVTNYGPSTATGVTLSDTLPASVTLLSSNATLGTVSALAGQITWNVGTLAINAGASLTVTVRPNAAGSITNTCFVVAGQTDPNFNNNAATVATTVNSAAADLILSLSDAPDPVWLGSNVTYTLTVTNAGPATATGVSITNTLPPTVAVISATPGGYTVAGGVLTFTNLGSLNFGAQTVATIVVKTTAGGTITNFALVTSPVTDPLKANNAASVKTVVQVLQLGVSGGGGGLVITWPTNTPGPVVLECATNLNPPQVWTTVTSPSPVVSNANYIITIPIGSGSKYFRLHGP